MESDAARPRPVPGAGPTPAAWSWAAGHALRSKAGWASLLPAGSRPKHEPRPQEQAWECLCAWAETEQVLSEGLTDSPSSNSASGYVGERQKKDAALKTGLMQ